MAEAESKGTDAPAAAATAPAAAEGAAEPTLSPGKHKGGVSFEVRFDVAGGGAGGATAPAADGALPPAPKVPKKYLQMGRGVEQVIKIFQMHDTNHSGCLEVHEIPGLCRDLNIKPWRAFKELETNEDGAVELSSFISWWFSRTTQATQAQKEQVQHIFDKYDPDGSGFLSTADTVKLCKEMGLPPWKLFREIDLDGDKKMSKRDFVSWWFRSYDDPHSEAAHRPVLPAGSPAKRAHGGAGGGAAASPGKGPRTPSKAATAPVSPPRAPAATPLQDRIDAAMAKVKEATAELEALLEEQKAGRRA